MGVTEVHPIGDRAACCVRGVGPIFVRRPEVSLVDASGVLGRAGDGQQKRQAADHDRQSHHLFSLVVGGRSVLVRRPGASTRIGRRSLRPRRPLRLPQLAVARAPGCYRRAGGGLWTTRAAETCEPENLRTGLVTWCRRQLFHHLCQAEAARLLPGWELLESRQPLRDESLRRHENEGAIEAPLAVAHALVIGTLERIGAHIEELRQTQLDEGFLPDVEAV